MRGAFSRFRLQTAEKAERGPAFSRDMRMGRRWPSAAFQGGSDFHAFGFGLERMTAMLYNIDDIRHMFENDVRFLEQFR